MVVRGPSVLVADWDGKELEKPFGGLRLNLGHDAKSFAKLQIFRVPTSPDCNITSFMVQREGIWKKSAILKTDNRNALTLRHANTVPAILANAGENAATKSNKRHKISPGS